MKNRKMRLIEGSREMEASEIERILKHSEYGIISSIGQDQMPYGIPMSYIYKDSNIYFHCGLKGHKIDNFDFNKNVSFTIVEKTRLIPKDLDTAYNSVIGFGKIYRLEAEEKLWVLEELVKKYAADYLDKGREEARRDLDHTGVYRIELEKISGKTRRFF